METGHSENVAAAWFKRKTGKEIHRSVVGKSARAGFHELDIDGPGAQRCRLRGPKCPYLTRGYSRGSSGKRNFTMESQTPTIDIRGNIYAPTTWNLCPEIIYIYYLCSASDAGRSKEEHFVSFRVCGRQYSSVL